MSNYEACLTNEQISEHVERARVVAVLDAWADRTGDSASHDTCRAPVGSWRCTLWQGHEGDDDAQHYGADSPDAARAAAAKAIESGEVG